MRTIANQLSSGFTIRMSDPGWQKVQWQLRYTGLTDGERESIENLFEAAEGQLNTFTFLDPMANLLAWSEDWTQALWSADPLLQVTGGIADPLGNSNAIQLTNTGGSNQQIVQNIAGPSAFQYCYSVYVRSSAPAIIQMVQTTTGQTSLAPVIAGASWVRVTTPVSLSAGQNGIGFGVQVPAGAQVEVFGAQVEAQPEAGLYKKTTNLGGVYTNTRFSTDLLSFAANAVNQHSCQVNLISNLN